MIAVASRPVQLGWTYRLQSVRFGEHYYVRADAVVVGGTVYKKASLPTWTTGEDFCFSAGKKNCFGVGCLRTYTPRR